MPDSPDTCVRKANTQRKSCGLKNTRMLVDEPKAFEQTFPVPLCIMLYEVLLRFESVREILKRDHSNENS